MKKSIINRRIFVCILPFAVILAAFLTAEFVLKYVRLPGCFLYDVTGIYCPGCGNTRSVAALLKGDVLLSLRENAAVILLVIIALLYYVELLAKTFGKYNFKTPLHNRYFWLALLVLLAIYYIARNFIDCIAPI